MDAGAIFVSHASSARWPACKHCRHESFRDRLRELALREQHLTLFCSHDPGQFEALAGRRLGDPLVRA